MIENGWFIQNMLIEYFAFVVSFFNSEKCKTSLGHDGCRDWKHTNDRLKEHDASTDHITNMNSWNELRAKLN
jgi:hypothetical protein